MQRCLDAAQRAFHVSRDALLPIAAKGADTPGSGMNEDTVTKLTRLANTGAHFYFDLLLRDRLMINVSVVLQNSRTK